MKLIIITPDDQSPSKAGVFSGLPFIGRCKKEVIELYQLDDWLDAFEKDEESTRFYIEKMEETEEELRITVSLNVEEHALILKHRQDLAHD